ncbi:membrane protein insertion efficiency factor YidD [Nocardia sp. IBHARD005]|uniref:membrane protein insertion efficiency factor YidD n=1 Tax=Nocardia sp. IBHARD005 TaxID=3457765 RepID=UPI004058A791
MRTLTRLPAKALISLIELYRTYVSPTRMPICRFTPTCSEYAVTALRTRGLVVGSALTVVRLAKCAPWHPGGWDPVPERGSKARMSGQRPEAEAERDHGGRPSMRNRHCTQSSPALIGDTNDGST